MASVEIECMNPKCCKVFPPSKGAPLECDECGSTEILVTNLERPEPSFSDYLEPYVDNRDEHDPTL